MDKINFIELFHSKELELPIKSFDKDAYIILKDLFDVYINLLEEYNLDKRDIKKSKEQCIHIKKAIEFYYLGNPVKAYDEIKTVLDNLYNNNQLILYKKNERFSRYSNNNDPLNLYRVRPIRKFKKYSRQEIFHVPYTRRRDVSSSRFSIAGYPSLYLGTSHQLSRIETELEKKSNYIVSKFKIEREINDCEIKIYILDLAIKPNKIEMFDNSSGVYNIDNLSFRKNYIEAYPIIAACSIMVEKKDKSFYPEYIIPQLLMQWLNEKAKKDRISRSIYGVRYFTCRSKNPRIKGYNYVFPVQSYDIDRGVENYCSVLGRIFKLTEPVCSNQEDFEEIMENGLMKKIF